MADKLVRHFLRARKRKIKERKYVRKVAKSRGRWLTAVACVYAIQTMRTKRGRLTSQYGGACDRLFQEREQLRFSAGRITASPLHTVAVTTTMFIIRAAPIKSPSGISPTLTYIARSPSSPGGLAFCHNLERFIFLWDSHRPAARRLIEQSDAVCRSTSGVIFFMHHGVYIPLP